MKLLKVCHYKVRELVLKEYIMLNFSILGSVHQHYPWRHKQIQEELSGNLCPALAL